MNAIICGFHQPTYRDVIFNVLKELKIKHCHLFYNEEGIRKIPEGIEAVQHDVFKIRFKTEYPLKSHEIKPLDKKIVESMANCEVLALKMMERLNARQEFEDSYQMRKNVYLKHLAYWNHVLDEENINFVLFHCIPHINYNFIIFNLCKLKGIRTIVLFQAQIDTVMFFDDYSEHNKDLKDNYKLLLGEFDKTELSEIELSPRIQRLYDEQVQSSRKPVPFYMEKHFKKKSVLPGIKWVLNHIKPNFYLKYFNLYRNRKKLNNFYEKFAVKPDFNDKFIYYPLHFQPELTTNPLAGAFVEQILSIKLLSYSLPSEYYLYVKEHPAQKSIGRLFTFYPEVAKLPNVKLIEKKYDSFTLMNNSIGIATATGTAAWEGLFRDKSSILFGNIFFEYAEGIFRVDTLEDCQNAINHIINGDMKPTLKSTRIFLKALENVTFQGYINYGYREVSKITEEENKINLKKAIIDKIQKLD